MRNPGARPVRAGAILVAAGRGERMGLGEGRPKALVDLCARPLAAYSLSVLEQDSSIEAVVLVAPPGSSARFRSELVERWGFRKVAAVVEGGRTRQESVRLGLEALNDELDPVVIHDAARPLVRPELVAACISKASVVGACVPGLSPAATVKAVTSGGFVERTLDRTLLREVQTPQAFKASLIREAHRLARLNRTEATDDSTLVENMGAPVALIEGDPENIKITRPIDMEVAAAVMSRRAGGGRG